MEFNTHSKSNAWTPLRQLFRRHVAEFVAAHADARYAEKHHIGAAMWHWMLERDFVPAHLVAEANNVHFRPGKGKDGHPLWRLAFKDSVRNTPEIDALFVGNRKGPTPAYARLIAAGVVPADPKSLVPEALSIPQPSGEVTNVPRYQAKQEWIVHEQGAEWLYIYTTARELSNFIDHHVPPMLKIGSSRGHYSGRIAQQAGSTAANTTLVCLHAYQVADARRIESAVHQALKVQGRHVKDVPGIEWFSISPDAAHELIRALSGGLAAKAPIANPGAGTQHREPEATPAVNTPQDIPARTDIEEQRSPCAESRQRDNLIPEAFGRLLTPSLELAAIVGTEPLPRTEIVRRLWIYIKEHDLQDKDEMRQIKADEALLAVFEKPILSMFELARVITKHTR